MFFTNEYFLQTAKTCLSIIVEIWIKLIKQVFPKKKEKEEILNLLHHVPFFMLLLLEIINYFILFDFLKSL